MSLQIVFTFCSSLTHFVSITLWSFLWRSIESFKIGRAMKRLSNICMLVSYMLHIYIFCEQIYKLSEIGPMSFRSSSQHTVSNRKVAGRLVLLLMHSDWVRWVSVWFHMTSLLLQLPTTVYCNLPPQSAHLWSCIK